MRPLILQVAVHASDIEGPHDTAPKVSMIKRRTTIVSMIARSLKVSGYWDIIKVMEKSPKRHLIAGPSPNQKALAFPSQSSVQTSDHQVDRLSARFKPGRSTTFILYLLLQDWAS
jgi:hypothetical protein